MAMAYGSYYMGGKRRSERAAGIKRRQQMSVDLRSLLYLDLGFFQAHILPFIPPYLHLCLRLRLVSATWQELFTEWVTHVTTDYMCISQQPNKGLHIWVHVIRWGHTFPNLAHIDASSCYNLNGPLLNMSLASMGWKLLELSVRGCRNLTTDSMVKLKNFCSNLQSLDVGKTSVSPFAISMVYMELSFSLTSLNIDGIRLRPASTKAIFKSTFHTSVRNILIPS